MHILLSWTCPVFSFLPYNFAILFSVYPFLYRRIIQHQTTPVELAHFPWRVSHILSLMEPYFEVDCFTNVTILLAFFRIPLLAIFKHSKQFLPTLLIHTIITIFVMKLP